MRAAVEHVLSGHSTDRTGAPLSVDGTLAGGPSANAGHVLRGLHPRPASGAAACRGAETRSNDHRRNRTAARRLRRCAHLRTAALGSWEGAGSRSHLGSPLRWPRLRPQPSSARKVTLPSRPGDPDASSFLILRVRSGRAAAAQRGSAVRHRSAGMPQLSAAGIHATQEARRPGSRCCPGRSAGRSPHGSGIVHRRRDERNR